MSTSNRFTDAAVVSGEAQEFYGAARQQLFFDVTGGHGYDPSVKNDGGMNASLGIDDGPKVL